MKNEIIPSVPSSGISDGENNLTEILGLERNAEVSFVAHTRI
jgi:hypothetical protein